ncbi:beta-lactamase-like protein [Podospora didyma]|uniref:Beta-lactamase-like protein n=1 Tax=Podospora didyma TaxID=330526 RepID=A0AAE0K8Q3_9PEZI|nr:beta-lactamase-like protein [Podospora didyma]
MRNLSLFVRLALWLSAAVVVTGSPKPPVSKALFDVPRGKTAQVSIIDSTMRFDGIPVSFFMGPPLPGFDMMGALTTWCFLVESSKGEKVLFDIGVPKDFTTYSPFVQEQIRNNTQSGATLTVEKDVADVLKENGVKLRDISSVIWSHFHFDHIGDIRTFPNKTDLVVGPGFKAAFFPGYPTIPNSPVQEYYFTGRNVREIDFTKQHPPLKAGQFSAFDFFGDGSFYLLDTPGHATGHLGGLARTSTNPDTFIFMGGDLCHHGSEIRPSQFLPIPAHVSFPAAVSEAYHRSRVTTCPGDTFAQLNTQRGRRVDQPFFDPLLGENITAMLDTIKGAQAADAQDDVFFIFAHDMGIDGVVDVFPKKANQWKKKGWGEKSLWNFLAELVPALGPAQAKTCKARY